MTTAIRGVAILLGLLLLALLALPMLIPIPELRDSVPPASLADPDSQFATANDLRVHFKAAGDGEPAIILLHGFGASLFSWHAVLEPLAQSGSVIAYDRPAFGLTERPLPGTWPAESPYSAEAQVDLLLELMDSQSIEQAVLVGNSAGGAIAVQAALEHPERVLGLVLISPAVLDVGGPPGPTWLYRLPPIDRLGPLIARTFIGRGRMLLDLAWHDPSRITPEIRQGYNKPLRADDWDVALWELTRASQPLGLEARLPELSVPTLVVTGASDQIVPPEDSQRVAELIPGAGWVVLPECGHLPQEECPQALLPLLRHFLQDLPTSSSEAVFGSMMEGMR